ncbi:hypothetical protein BN2476_1010021 [Paraburkholderia piptadeniae]|uniref:Transposase n=1 Tax=Paraburkholderia piptadeniae TaxID=1701573 RepID=A0A1N7SUF0_9BURK|nr:hypothetical protein BN2476_1010021 [Paraburkholderia piptadeniae]
MPNRAVIPYKQNKVPRSASVYRLISNVQNVKKRNLLRGYCSATRRLFLDTLDLYQFVI